MNTTGQVKRILSKPAGKGTAYNFVVVENGQDVWYGHGFAPPKFQEGDTVSFEWTQNGNFKNVLPRTVRVVAGEPASSPAPQQSQSAPPARGGFGNNQLAIQYQASRNSAIAVVEAAIRSDSLPLPAKKGDRYDALLALVDDLTNQFHIKTDKVVENGGVVLEELEQALAQDDF